MRRALPLDDHAIRELGAIGARQEAQATRLEAIERVICEDRKESADDRRLLLERLDKIDARLTGRDAEHERRLAGLELFRNQIMAVVALAGTAMSFLVAGLYYLISGFWTDLVAAFRRLWP